MKIAKDSTPELNMPKFPPTVETITEQHVVGGSGGGGSGVAGERKHKRDENEGDDDDHYAAGHLQSK
jgi:hypothetical protein